MERLFSKDTEKLFACNSLKLEEHASFSSARIRTVFRRRDVRQQSRLFAHVNRRLRPSPNSNRIS
jgi:hypothetical protein